MKVRLTLNISHPDLFDKQMKHHVVTYISGVCAVQINREPLLTKLIDLQISCVHLIGICDFPTVGEALIGTRISYLWILHGIIELVQWIEVIYAIMVGGA